MTVTIHWFNHASFRISNETHTIYIDPWKLSNPQPDADIILISHSHYDHYSPEDINGIVQNDSAIIAPADIDITHPHFQTIAPGQTVSVNNVTIQAVPAYNPGKKFHPQQNAWLGFIITLDGKRVYYAGDTDIIDEMNDLGDIDAALLPVGGTYTLSAAQAVQAVEIINPRLAVPYHWGDIVGSESDAKQFAKLAPCSVKILHPGTSCTL